ncbi:MAG: radical SAM protein [Candidatus Bathyarchaeia archaeon]|nr:radical SAM protein [Candidatus Bathyarchaeota archaeon]
MSVSKGVERVRVSIGSAIVLGLVKGVINAKPTTVYLLTYREGRCSANCAFCPQARDSTSRADMLSRVIWPDFTLSDVVSSIIRSVENGEIKRVCIQALNYAGVQRDLEYLVSKIRSTCEVPISVSCQPLTPEDMRMLLSAGVERISIALDAVTEEIFSRVKGELANGPYRWRLHLNSLRDAVRVFGRGKVTTHLIAGLGESEEEFISMMQKCVDEGVFPALFAFTPIQGTRMANHPRPPITYYRKLQIAHYLITHRIRRYEDMAFMDGRLINFGLPNEDLMRIILTGEPFKTSGCPGCNRPYYNEDPRGPIYNYPRDLNAKDIASVLREVNLALSQ